MYIAQTNSLKAVQIPPPPLLFNPGGNTDIHMRNQIYVIVPTYSTELPDLDDMEQVFGTVPVIPSVFDLSTPFTMPTLSSLELLTNDGRELTTPLLPPRGPNLTPRAHSPLPPARAPPLPPRPPGWRTR